MLALKAEATVQKSLELLRRAQPEKPVIALSSTMGSFIGQYAQLSDLKPGEAIALSFGDLLRRYLDRSREVIVGKPFGTKERHYLTDAELGPEGVAQYEAVLDLIDETDLSDIPISPIDYIKFRLEREGYRLGEITGREHAIDYTSNGETFYQRRSESERSKATAVENVSAFNGGQLDALILNRSGSTGISLHASEKFTAQRRRHMIVVQPERDINQFMQMLGRVHRTGQVVTPNFTLLMADIPAEKRPGAVLAKKMASLNAKTPRKPFHAFEQFPEGKLINFSDHKGQMRQGLITPKDFEIEKALQQQPVLMPTVEDAYRFLNEKMGQLKTADELLVVKPHRQGEGYLVQTSKQKDLAGRYYLDQQLLAALGSEFNSVGDRMQCHLDNERLHSVLETIMVEKSWRLAAFEETDVAREMLGLSLPKLEEVEPEPESFPSLTMMKIAEGGEVTSSVQSSSCAENRSAWDILAQDEALEVESIVEPVSETAPLLPEPSFLLDFDDLLAQVREQLESDGQLVSRLLGSSNFRDSFAVEVQKAVDSLTLAVLNQHCTGRLSTIVLRPHKFYWRMGLTQTLRITRTRQHCTGRL